MDRTDELSGFEFYMYVAVAHLRQARGLLADAGWAEPEEFDATEDLRKRTDNLIKRIEREQARWRREHEES